LPLKYTNQFNMRAGDKWVKSTKNSQEALHKIDKKVSYGIYMKSNRIPEKLKKIGGGQKTMKQTSKNYISEESNKIVNTYDSVDKDH